MKKTITSKHGFALFEVVVVILLLSVMAVFTFSYLTDFSSASLRTQADLFTAHVRYAQMRAMNTDTTFGIRYEKTLGLTHYWLFKENQSQKIAFPGEAQNTVRLDDQGIAITGLNNFTLAFDSWGRPDLAGPAFNSGIAVLTVFKSGQTPLNITIAEHTGFAK